MMANYRLKKRWHVGKLIKDNPKTILVEAPDGKTIKRHKMKHGARIVER